MARAPPPAHSDDVRQFTIEAEDEGIRLDRWFKRHLPDASFNIVSRWARTGQLRLDGARATPATRVVAGQQVRVPPAEAPKAARPKRERAALTPDQEDFAQRLVIYRDRHALVLNKPPGLATQGGTGITESVDGLLDALEFDSDHRPRLVHRLDKDTSGALLVARSPSAAAVFSKSFASRNARKIYWALIMGIPDVYNGVIDLPLSKQPGSGGEKMHVDTENGQAAKTRYRLIERAGSAACWVELQPFTGRTHQLRVHMAAIGHPIVGDGKYGGRDAFLTGSISRKLHLHARSIRIDAPGKDRIDVTAEPPEHFAATLASLGFDRAAGDLPFDDSPLPETRAETKTRARAHAKQVRKSKRGERRARSEPPQGKPPKSKADRKSPGKSTRSTPRPSPKKH